MKPYFKLGYGYRDFMKLFFQKDYYEDIGHKEDEEDNQKRNWCERNLIIKDPNSRLFFLWELVFLIAFLIEIVLVPYTSCSKDIDWILEENTKALEQVIDVIWIINITLSFLTPSEPDISYEN